MIIRLLLLLLRHILKTKTIPITAVLTRRPRSELNPPSSFHRATGPESFVRPVTLDERYSGKQRTGPPNRPHFRESQRCARSLWTSLNRFDSTTSFADGSDLIRSTVPTRRKSRLPKRHGLRSIEAGNRNTRSETATPPSTTTRVRLSTASPEVSITCS